MQVCMTPEANLPPVTKTPTVPVPNLAPVSLIMVANLPLVSLIPEVGLDLRLPSRIFKKTQNDLKVVFMGLGEDSS